MNKSKSKFTVRKVIGILVCIIGAMIFFYPNVREYKTHVEIERIEESFKKIREDRSTDTTGETAVISAEEAKDATTSYDGLYMEMTGYNTSLFESGQKLSDAFSYEDTPVDLSEFGSDKAIGYIEIPSIGCSLPLYLGASTDHLSRGAAVMGNTSMPIGGENTNCVIAAHRGYKGSAFFRNIGDIAEGDTVKIVNPWEDLYYKAVSMEIIDPTNTDPLKIKEGEDSITLVSCHPYRIGGGKQRLVVHCVRDDAAVSVSENITVRESHDGSTDTGTYGSSGTDTYTKYTHNIYENDSGENLLTVESTLRLVLPFAFIILLLIIIFPKRRKPRNES
jgi:sortase A